MKSFFYLNTIQNEIVKIVKIPISRCLKFETEAHGEFGASNNLHILVLGLQNNSPSSHHTCTWNNGIMLLSHFRAKFGRKAELILHASVGSTGTHPWAWNINQLLRESPIETRSTLSATVLLRWGTDLNKDLNQYPKVVYDRKCNGRFISLVWVKNDIYS